MWPRVMRNVVDVSSFFLVEATGDSEADRRRRRGPAQDNGGDDDDDDDSSSTVDEMDIDAESRNSKSKTVMFGRRPAGDRQQQQVKCCEFVRAWIEDCCRCKSRLIQKDDDDDDDVDYDQDEDEVSSEVIKKVAAASLDSDNNNNITMAADDDDDDDEKEKSRRFWETCLAS